MGYLPRLIAWELTRSCMLACKHCRAAAKPTPYTDELTTQECKKLLDNIASFSKPVMILTGGEPMLRPDLYEIAAYAHSLGLAPALAPCGMLIDDEAARKMLAAGIRRISISLDGATAESHDAFRCVPGAFAGSMRGLEAAKRAGLEFQINTTVTQHNRKELQEIMELSIRLGAKVFNPFLLVPTGRGKELADQELSPGQYEEALVWLADQQAAGRIEIRVTCAPHYQRIVRQRHALPEGRPVKGCMGGQSFAFISHRGKVQICGFLDIECGDVRKENYNFRKVWETSETFLQMRNLDGYHGRCGRCEFRKVCGGCRARSFAVTGDYLDEEPFCSYGPRRRAAGDKPAPDDVDAKILAAAQAGLPVAEEPFAALAGELGMPAERVIERVAKLHESGVIRRLGAVFDSRSLGYSSTLVAARVPAERLDEIAALVSELPGVTHNYARQNSYNLWFTLTARSAGEIDEILAELRRRTGIAEFHSLPALTVYKIRVFFGSAQETPAAAAPVSAKGMQFSEADRQLVRALQEDIPLSARPFDAIAGQLGVPVEAVVEKIRAWMAAGVVRRLAAVVRHHQMGYTANGMAVFAAPAEAIDEWGRRLAQIPQVSHCYRRPAMADFPYTLFAMFHGQSESEVRGLAARAAAELGGPDHDVLFSHKEFKKVSMRYFRES
ncbi:MAG: radical SAM protein [Planctomycetota bacterium]|nr:radical SAM protein [Planctomycetota bacterium]